MSFSLALTLRPAGKTAHPERNLAVQEGEMARLAARNPRVDKSLGGSTRWRQETDMLRGILLASGLTEELKWRAPCYAHDGKNICIIQSMKDFLALLFFKGALLKDPDGVLERQGPNSRAGFRMRFTSVEDVAGMAESIKAYTREAIEVERAGRRVEKAKPADLEYPEELIEKLGEDPDFRDAIDKLTPGRQRGYVLHFAGAKQAKTRIARIEKFRRKILDGKGFHDRQVWTRHVGDHKRRSEQSSGAAPGPCTSAGTGSVP